MAENPNQIRILFVCSENECRSQIAEAFARMFGGSAIEAFSAGERPAAQVDPRAVEFMASCGYDLSVHFPKTFGNIPHETFDLAVTMDPGASSSPVHAARWVAWNVPRPALLSNDDFAVLGVAIESHVRELLSNLP